VPAPKRRIFDYARDFSDFASDANLKQILLVRLMPSVFCIDLQIDDWPKAIRGVGQHRPGCAA
jgi:hypothetical protein